MFHRNCWPGDYFLPLVPTLRVGMPSGTLRVRSVCPGDRDDAERRRRHSHAEHGNETGRRASGVRRGVSKYSGRISPSVQEHVVPPRRAGGEVHVGPGRGAGDLDCAGCPCRGHRRRGGWGLFTGSTPPQPQASFGFVSCRPFCWQSAPECSNREARCLHFIRLEGRFSETVPPVGRSGDDAPRLSTPGEPEGFGGVPGAPGRRSGELTS